MESSTIAAAVGRAVDAPTLTEALRRTAANHPDIVAVRDARRQRLADVVRAARARRRASPAAWRSSASGAGDTVAIMLGNRPEFHIVDLAAAMLGATPFSIYVTYPAEEIRYLCSDAAPGWRSSSRRSCPVMLEARKNLPGLEHVIVVDGDAPRGNALARRRRGLEPRLRRPGRRGRDRARTTSLTLIYTSGTTGPPKGVQLSHRNVMCRGARRSRRSSRSSRAAG